MKYALLIGVTCAYAIQTAICFWTGDRAQGVVIAGYTIANVGLIWTVWGQP